MKSFKSLLLALVFVSSSSYADEMKFKDWVVWEDENAVFAMTFNDQASFGKICNKATRECAFSLIAKHSCKEDDIVPLLVSSAKNYKSLMAKCFQSGRDKELKVFALKSEDLVSNALDDGLIGFALPEAKAKFFSFRFSLSGSNAAILNALDRVGLIGKKINQERPGSNSF